MEEEYDIQRSFRSRMLSKIGKSLAAGVLFLGTAYAGILTGYDRGIRHASERYLEAHAELEYADTYTMNFSGSIPLFPDTAMPGLEEPSVVGCVWDPKGELTIQKDFGVTGGSLVRRISFAEVATYVELSHDSLDPNHYVTPEETVLDYIVHDFLRLPTQDRLSDIYAIADFVQNIPHNYEADEHPHYPLETLLATGDCDDKSILMASMLEILGYTDYIFLEHPEHLNMGIAVDAELEGSYVLHEGVKYYELEFNAGPDYTLGMCDSEIRDCSLPPLGIIPRRRP